MLFVEKNTSKQLVAINIITIEKCLKSTNVYLTINKTKVRR